MVAQVRLCRGRAAWSPSWPWSFSSAGLVLGPFYDRHLAQPAFSSLRVLCFIVIHSLLQRKLHLTSVDENDIDIFFTQTVID